MLIDGNSEPTSVFADKSRTIFVVDEQSRRVIKVEEETRAFSVVIDVLSIIHRYSVRIYQKVCVVVVTIDNMRIFYVVNHWTSRLVR
jgi:hypothetical protein